MIAVGVAVGVACGGEPEAATAPTDVSAPVSCSPGAGGIATLTLSVPIGATTGSGTLVVSDPVTRASTSRALAITGPSEATQPKAITLVVEGCADWYDTWLLTCPETDSTRTVELEAHPSAGEAVITGAAGTAVVTVRERAGGDVDVVVSTGSVRRVAASAPGPPRCR